eukprot:m.252999 g.252999  ORF g.252999 m.252999 type:complete len:391 (+) comp40361_c0_seq4:574-1746(+)
MAALAGGFDEKFLDLPERLTCPICACGLKQPQLTKCGHRFCDGCLAALEKDGDSVTCPVCRTRLMPSQIFADNAIKREVLDLEVQCRRSSSSCKWTGELRELAKHYAQCPFGILLCPLNCGQSVMRRNLKIHAEKECLKQRIACRYCFLAIERRYLENHHQECSKCPVACPMGCSLKISRCDLESHISSSGTCPNVILDCLFQDAGCSFKGRRRDMDKHMETEMIKHLSMSHKQITELKEELRSVSFSYCWEITEWTKKFEEAMQTVEGKKTLFSEAFYIKKPGHKMRMKLGISASDGIGLHLSPVQGEYDKDIQWPFRQAYSLVVVDQRKSGKDKKHIVTKKELDEKFSLLFCKPDDKGVGKRKLLKLDEIAKFAKDDCLLIKVTVYRW